MGFVKSSVPVLTAILLSGSVLAATSNNAPATKPAQPAQAYADIAPGQAGSTTQTTIPADVNTDVPYASMLPKGAEIVPGDPSKNEFFIVAAEDAAKIKQLLEHTKPGTDIAAADIKSKQPIMKVKLDANNATLVSMDVVSSVKTVAKQAMKPSVQMTETDEVMSIFTKNRITPVGSRAVAAASAPKVKPIPAEVDEKPMLKLFASAHQANTSSVAPSTAAINNPLLATASAKPATKGVMPDKVAMKQTIDQPIEKPVQLPVASKEAAPTLEMVLQQATNNKVKNETAEAFKTAVDEADAKVKKPAAKPAIKKTVATKAKAKKSVVSAKKVVGAKKLVVGKIIPYEQIAPEKKKAVAWNARHTVATKSKKVAAKKAVTKKIATKKKRTLNVGVVRSYADYLAKTGHRARHTTE